MKYFGLAAAALVMTIAASAASVSVTCTAVNSSPGSAVITPTTLTCPDFATLPAGDTATSIQLFAGDSFDGGTFGQTNIIDVNYSSINGAITGLPGSLPNSCIGAAGTGSTCTAEVSGTTSGNTGSSTFAFGNAITTSLGSFIGGTTFNVASVTSAVDAGSALPPLTGTGDVTAQLFATLTYSTAAPEPGSMMLLGSGLFAAGLIGRKKLAGKK
jgi:hypothetical protein